METQNQHNDSFKGSNSIPKQNNFRVPEGYFDELASRLETELDIKNETAPKKGIVRMLAINISIAAAVVLGVFLFNPEKGVRLGETLAAMEVEDPNAISVEDYMLSMVDYTDEWQPLESYELDMVSVTEEEVIAVEMPIVNEEVTTEDLTDFFEDEDYYDYEF